jgi:hypothetical protein
MNDQPQSRIQISSDRDRSLRQCQALLRSGTIARAVLIAQHTDGGFHLIGHGATAEEIAPLLMVGAKALVRIADDHADHPTPPTELDTGPNDDPPATLAAGFAKLARAVMPPDAPPEQRQDSKRFYYAGAQSVFTILANGLDPGDETTDADLARTEALVAELESYRRALLEGRA